MVLVIREESANEAFAAACRAVIREGQEVAPRGLRTKEILGAHICVTNPRRRFVDVPPHRVLNPAFAVAEALWIMSGSDDSWIFDFNRNLEQYADDGKLQGAYGPRMRRWREGIDQLTRVRTLLLTDPDSRQAVIQLYDPERDSRGYKDVPCTLGYRFYVRRGTLHMHTTMRSQDLWLGFPYDVFTATLIHEVMATWIGVELGEYHHHIDSLHLYEQNLPAAGQLPAEVIASPEMPVLSLDFEHADSVLAAVVSGEADIELAGWYEFAQAMRSYRAWTAGQRDEARLIARGLGGELGAALGRWYDRLASRPVATTPADVPALP